MNTKLNRIVIVSGILAVTSLSAYAAYWNSWRVTVQSADYHWRLLRVPTDRPIRLVKQISKAACIEGRTWGVTRRGIWVKDGCRAVFEIAGARPPHWRRGWDSTRYNGDPDISRNSGWDGNQDWSNRGWDH